MYDYNVSLYHTIAFESLQLAEVPMAQRTYEKFLASIVKEDSGCWIWQKDCYSNGYGRLWTGVRQVRAHRWSFEYHKGPIAPGNFVCHTCDNPLCVNPYHLFQGTVGDNTRDCIKKGRAGFQRPEWTPPSPGLGGAHHSSKLTAEDAAYIKKYPVRYGSNKELAKMFGVSSQTISDIRYGRHFTYVTS